MQGEHQCPRRSNPGSQPESVPACGWARTASLSTGSRNNVKMVWESAEKVKGESSRISRRGGDPEQQQQSTAGPELQRVGASTASGLFTQPSHPLIFNTLEPTTSILHCTNSPREDVSPLHVRLVLS